MRPLDDSTLARELRERFGHSAFRSGQLDVLRSVLAGKPTLAVMPTGAGKSLCYQLPALMLSGVTVVVSPLLSLMKDQVDELRRRNVSAAFINSSQSEGERTATELEMAAGRYRLVYVSPERIRNAAFRRSLSKADVSLLAIDEAHCISEWGHAFRPDYQRLGEALTELKIPRMLALTATATAEVRADIVRALRWRQPNIVVTGFDRPNLHLEFHDLASEAEKHDSIVAAVREHRPAIVYAATRRQSMAISRLLTTSDIRSAPYHAGLASSVREWTQEGFLKGDLDVIAATNAFGLGIDKQDVRLVLHATIPRSIEAWYQEAGRAGRDGRSAIAGLFVTMGDLFLRRRLLIQAMPSPAIVEAISRKLAASREPLPVEHLARNLPNEATGPRITATLAFLESLGVIARHSAPTGDGSLTNLYRAERGRQLTSDDLHQLKIRSLRERARLERMVALARQSNCRRRVLLRELGEPGLRERCDSCDICSGSRLHPVRSRLEKQGSEEGVRSDSLWDMSTPHVRLSRNGGLAQVSAG